MICLIPTFNRMMARAMTTMMIVATATPMLSSMACLFFAFLMSSSTSFCSWPSIPHFSKSSWISRGYVCWANVSFWDNQRDVIKYWQLLPMIFTMVGGGKFWWQLFSKWYSSKNCADFLLNESFLSQHVRWWTGHPCPRPHLRLTKFNIYLGQRIEFYHYKPQSVRQGSYKLK